MEEWKTNGPEGVTSITIIRTAVYSNGPIITPTSAAGGITAAAVATFTYRSTAAATTGTKMAAALQQYALV